MAKLAGRDLSERLRERPLVSSDALTPGSVMLIETRDGRYALLRVDPARFPRVHGDAARSLEAFLLSTPTRERIAAFGRDRYGRALFFPIEAGSEP